MEEQITYKEIMVSQQGEWDGRIETQIRELQLKVNTCEPGEKEKYLAQIEVLKIKQLFLQDKLDDLKKTIDTAWAEMRTEIDFTWKIFIRTINKSVFEKN